MATVFLGAAAETCGGAILPTFARVARGFASDAFAAGLASLRGAALVCGFFSFFALLFFTLAARILAGTARRRETDVRAEPLLGTQSPFLS
ncbi:MAG: hypothetical protein ACREFZ_07040 [Acetobacteraceae bacterium]